MTRVKSQIQHDYKSLVKPAGPAPSSKTHRWFLIGMGIPVALVVLVLLFSPGGQSQTAIAATGQESHLATQSEPLSVDTDLPLPAVNDVAEHEDVNDAGDPTVATPADDSDRSKDRPEPANREQRQRTLALPKRAIPAAPTNTPVAPDAPSANTAPVVVPLPGPAADAETGRTAIRTATDGPFDKPVARADEALGGQTRPLPIPARPTLVARADDAPLPLPGDALKLTVKKGDTLDEMFSDNNLSRTDLANILSIDEVKTALTLLMPGDEIDVRHEGKRLTYLARQIDEVRTLHVTRGDDGFTTHISEMPVEVRINHASATITSSLFLAAKAAGISDTLTMNLAGIFAWDIDFVLDIRQGDRFSVIYEEIWQNGRRLRDGDIVAAMFENDGDEFKALRYVDPDGDSGYFTPDGVNVKKAFLRAPIKFTPRVTSNFNPRRLHPVHNRVRPHRGVDYGAPTGTPIIAAGDGKVIFRGRKGGYGNTVILQHGSNITTLYAHMSKFNRKVRSGSRVKQGQIIGYVGATGTVTARHLHYEYRVNGVHRNPRTVSLPKAKPVPAKLAADFKMATAPLLNQLNVVSRDPTRVASAAD